MASLGGFVLDIFYRFFGKPSQHPAFLDFKEVDRKMPGKRTWLVGQIIIDARNSWKKIADNPIKNIAEPNVSFVPYWENRVLDTVFSMNYPVPCSDIKLADETASQTIIELVDGNVDLRTSVMWSEVVERLRSRASVRNLFPSLFDGNLVVLADSYKRQKEARIAAEAERRRVAAERARQQREVGLFEIGKHRERIRALEQIAMYGGSFDERVRAIYGIEASQRSIRAIKSQIGYVQDSYEDNMRTG